MTAADKKPKWIVRECGSRSDLERLYRFRYEEYVAGKGLFRDAADHENRWLTDPVDLFATNFLADADGEVIGSIRLNGLDRFVQTFVITEYKALDVSPEALDRGCVVTRAMVHPSWRSTPVFADLALNAARKMRDDGMRWMFIDTSPPRAAGEEPKFISLYSAFGFKIWRRDAAVPGIGPGTVMLLDLDEAMRDPRTMAHAYL